ncbi:MAG: sensor signal transduction histidine kinase [Massilibacillus sp.]|nr:sensor signal transduction histidine kinase [Massilibacillus sp.]
MRLKKLSEGRSSKSITPSYRAFEFCEVLNSIPVPLFIKDLDGIYINCNKSYEKFIGLHKDEIIGKSVYNLAPKKLADVYHTKDQELFEQGNVQIYESMVTTAEMNRYVIFHKSIYRNEVGDVSGLVGAVIDITEQKKAEEFLRVSEEKNKALLEAIPDAMAVVTSEFIILEFKKAKEFGNIRDGQFFIGKTTTEVLPEDAARLYMKNITSAFQTRKVTCFEYQVVHNREIRYREARVVAIPNENALIMIRDITERKIAEAEIHKLSLVVEQSPGEIVITDINEKIVYVNSKFSQNSGYTLDELKGVNVSFLMAGLQSDETYSVIQKITSSGSEWRGEICSKRKSGELRWVLVSLSPLRTLDGEATNYLSVGQDITDKKLMEETLGKRNAEIKDALDNLEQTQIQLVQQEKMAGIGQLAAGVAHEINNPLGFVLSNFDCLKQYVINITEIVNQYRELKDRALESEVQNLKEMAEQLVDMEKKKKIDYIFEDLDPLMQESDEGLKRLSGIVKALKSFSRVDQGSEFESYDLNAGIKNTLIVAKNEIKYVAEIEVELGELPHIQALAGQINQVLLNIILNAAYAIKEKKMDKLGRVKITSYHDNQFAYCLIQDNGIGMSEETAKNIFNAFFTTKPVGEGTGLGLSISYDIIVNKHHGNISVISEKGTGTTFTIKLPL